MLFCDSLTRQHLNAMPVCLVLLTLVIFAYPVSGQYGSGVLLGTVTDPSGGVVPSAKVEARNKATNETREFTTDDSGNFQFNALPAGTYSVLVTASGFKQSKFDDVLLRVNSQLRLDVPLQLGTAAESVQVHGETPQLQTNTAVIGTVVDNRTVRELPFNQRTFYDLVALTPGVIKVRGTSSVMDEISA